MMILSRAKLLKQLFLSGWDEAVLCILKEGRANNSRKMDVNRLLDQAVKMYYACLGTVHYPDEWKKERNHDNIGSSYLQSSAEAISRGGSIAWKA
jgi:hypothetical protein